MTTRNLADLAAALGIAIDLEDDDLVEGMIVLVKVNRADPTRPGLIFASEGYTWLERTGALSYAYDCADQDELWTDRPDPPAA